MKTIVMKALLYVLIRDGDLQPWRLDEVVDQHLLKVARAGNAHFSNGTIEAHVQVAIDRIEFALRGEEPTDIKAEKGGV